MESYRASSRLLAPLLTRSGPGLKALAFSGSGPAPPKAVYATVIHTLRSVKTLDLIVAEANKNENVDVIGSVRDTALCYVLLYEMLLGPYKNIRGGGGVKRALIKHEKALRSAMKSIAMNGSTEHKFVIESAAANGSGTGNPDKWPKYIRVNTLKTTLASALTTAQTRYGPTNVTLHPLIDNLLVLPSSSAKDLHEWDFIANGEGVLQDLSSCMTAVALAGGTGRRWWDDSNSKEKEGVTFLDACAAPGNKTTHLASIVNNSLSSSSSTKNKKTMMNKVIALDRDSKRVKILQKRVSLLAPNGEVKPLHMDFLKTEPSDVQFKNLKGILLDPSCSGSGIVSAPDRLGDDETLDETEARLSSLSAFQLLALVHSMSFEQVDYIAYSTCSVNDIENEEVVSKALSEVNSQVTDESMNWQVVAPKSLEGWSRRGNVVDGITEKQAKCLVRCDARDGDETNGFFVAYFQRKRVDGYEVGGNKMNIKKKQSKDVVDASASASGGVKMMDITRGFGGGAAVSAAVKRVVTIANGNEGEEPVSVKLYEVGMFIGEGFDAVEVKKVKKRQWVEPVREVGVEKEKASDGGGKVVVKKVKGPSDQQAHPVASKPVVDGSKSKSKGEEEKKTDNNTNSKKKRKFEKKDESQMTDAEKENAAAFHKKKIDKKMRFKEKQKVQMLERKEKKGTAKK